MANQSRTGERYRPTEDHIIGDEERQLNAPYTPPANATAGKFRRLANQKSFSFKAHHKLLVEMGLEEETQS